jgi:hypothetical protein
MPVCDGCGAQVDDAHIRQRIERLELATRFRPVHISLLLIDAAPPARPEDYFYRASANRADRSSASRAYFDALMQVAGIPPAAQASEESALAEFQRRGFFLIGAVECPPLAGAGLPGAIEHTALNTLRRVNVSYKPKAIALLSAQTLPLVAVFQQTDWVSRLVLDDGKPFDVPLSPGRLARALAQKGKD